MTTYSADKLYQWLPAIYRIRDAEQDGVLRDLLTLIAEQAGALENDITQLYDNWFIETCDEWVMPYLGDLLGVRLLHPLGKAGVYSLRAYVANALAYRRRKGTAAVLEQLARDLTGWPARAVEFFELLSTTQHVNHVRLHNVRTPDLRDSAALELLGTPFQNAAHTGEVRRIARQRGRYNIPNVGLCQWRLQSYAVERSTPRAAADAKDGCYRFDPLGHDIPLFNRPQTEAEITHLAEEVNVPGPLRRRPLYDELTARRRALAQSERPASRYFGQQPVFQVFLEGQSEAVPAEQMVICNLAGWEAPGWNSPTCKLEQDLNPTSPIQVAADPVLGRLVQLTQAKPAAVSYAYGFSGDVGGGPYNRQASVSPDWLRHVTWQVGVSQEESAVGGESIFQTVKDAVAAWKIQPAGTVGVIAILDSRTYDEPPLQLTIPAGSELLIAAASWPKVDKPGSSGQKMRIRGQVVLDRLRPHLKLNLSVQGGAAGKLALNGLCLEGTLAVQAGELASLELAHCTLPPDQSALGIEGNDQMELALQRSIVGSLSLRSAITLKVLDSIVDSATERIVGWAINALNAQVEVESSTILGGVRVRRLDGANSIFLGRVQAERTQVGCLRFCYLHSAGRVPRRHRCQPDWAVQQEIQAAQEKNPKLTAAQKLKIRQGVEAWLYPTFTDLTFGQPAYGQLRSSCPVEIRTGAEDEAEMGVFHHLQQPQREANLRQTLEEYLRFGLEAGIFYVT